MTNPSDMRRAAYTLRDPSMPITLHIADLLDAIAAHDTDASVAAAAAKLTEYVNAGTLVGAR